MFKRQDKVHFRYLDWEVSLHENGAKPKGPQWQKEFAMLFKKMENPDIVLKHDHRSEVGIFEAGNLRYIVKKFTFQGTRLWFRLASILFPTLGEISCRNSLRLSADGIATPPPVILMQRSRNHMVVGSWLVYRYLEGQLLTSRDTSDIVSFVKAMHREGWVHRDPHPANFIRTAHGIITLDPIRMKSTRSRYLKAYDVVLMENDMPNAPDLYGRMQLGFWLPVAHIGYNLVKFYRAVKLGLRRLLGISRWYYKEI